MGELRKGPMLAPVTAGNPRPTATPTTDPATERSNSALLMHGSSVLAFLCRCPRGPKIQTKRSICVQAYFTTSARRLEGVGGGD